ncbi:hypothetical protein BLNAU_11466 [Blattamonas nauphoetae]|uniref:Uncharacterized protein n=1 Tax=Blattamonas nauphoetae TaxID=2049346 RepID=A0ABQ9XMF8_9EUKA|nr:hypothetical protein BLNAU_11466 [Blattamonas nauphoetae]
MCISSGVKEIESRPLRLFLDEQLQQSNSKNQNGNGIIHLPNGIFSSCGYRVISRTLNLEGMKTEVHISVERNALETETQNGFDSSSADEDWQLSIFRIRNSTVSLRSLCLNSEGRSSLIASVSSSFVTVSESDIRSNGMNSPFVMLTGMADEQSGDIGSSLDIWNCRHISSSLVSLVPLAELSHKSDLTMNAGKVWMTIAETQFIEEMRISACSLSMFDCCLTFGTGPLIGFGGLTAKTEDVGKQADQPWKVSSQLMKSQIVNTTCTPSNWIDHELDGMELTQLVTGSRVCSSTNHLYGTACVDMNVKVMGSLLSLNTSFSSCSTDTPTHLGQHFSDRQDLAQSAFFKLCTFKDCSSPSHGGAIKFVGEQGSLLVDECSFETCRMTSQSYYGGAVYYNGSTGASFIAKSSSFVGCSSARYAGSICLNGSSTTLFNCVFINSTSPSHGGSVYSQRWNALSTSSSITNCLFDHSKTTGTDSDQRYSGGAFYFVKAFSIQFNFVRFRGNEAAQYHGNDIMFADSTALITSETMVECISTSSSPRLRVYEEAKGKDDYLPNPATTVTYVSCVGTAIDSDTAEFTLKMSEPITGTVLVLIDNSGGTRTPTGDQAPNIGRVLSFSFDNSDSSSCRVSLGESGLVQTPLSAYKVITSSFVGSVILSANFAMDPNEKNALITISGSGIPSGIISATLSDNIVLDFTFTPNQATSEVLTVPLTGTSPKLQRGETYKIVSAQSQTIPSHLIIIPLLIEIIVPNPSRLTTLKAPEYDEARKTVRIDMEGVDLDGSYKVSLSVNKTETVTIDVVFSSSEGQLGGILFDTETPTKANMFFNTRYEIVGMKQGEGKVLCLGDLSFTTMAEPTRLVTMECEFDKAKKNAFIQISGRALETTSTYKVGLSISGSLKHTVVMSFNSTTELWEGSALLYPSSSAELEYGKTYSVSSFQKGGNTTELLFEANSIEMTPEPPRLVKVESINAVGLNSTTLTLSTLALTDGAKYTLELKGTPLGSHIAANALLPSLATGDIPTIIETDACSFSTPIFPERLVNLSCDGTFSDPKKKTITVTFESLGLKSLTEYSIVLKSPATKEVPSHTKTLKLKTDANGLLPSHTAVLFPAKTVADELEGQLEFGSTYTVDGFKRGVETLLYDTEHITLTAPPEPARLTEIGCTGSTDKMKKATLSVIGRKMSRHLSSPIKIGKTGIN